MYTDDKTKPSVAGTIVQEKASKQPKNGTENQTINTLKEGDFINLVFRLVSRELLLTRGGKPYLNLVFGDKTGEIEGKVWESAETINEHIQKCSYVRITGAIGTYRNRLQIKVEQIRAVPESEVDPGLFLPVTEKDPDKMLKKLQKLCSDNMEDPHLKKLLKLFFGDKALMEKFKMSPAAKGLHHTFIGGLLEHTLSVTKICEFLCRHYPKINKDLLLTGAVLHDIGKTEELTSTPNFDYTTEGRLIGHIVIGYRMFEQKADQIADFPPRLRMLLGHMLLSHQGQYEFKTPVIPMFTEAMILYHVDNLDAKAELTKRHIDGDTRTDSDFTSYHKLLERFFYKSVDEK